MKFGRRQQQSEHSPEAPAPPNPTPLTVTPLPLVQFVTSTLEAVTQAQAECNDYAVRLAMRKDNPAGMLRRPRAQIEKMSLRLQVAFVASNKGGELDPECIVDSEALSKLPQQTISTIDLVLSVREDDPTTL